MIRHSPPNYQGKFLALFTRLRDLKMARLFPFYEFTRLHERKVPRIDWPERWDAAREESADELGAFAAPQMLALITHPIWSSLSRFGTPFAPFDFNSGMGLRRISQSEAKSRGLLHSPALRQTITNQAKETQLAPSPNATTEARPSLASERAFRAAMAERLKGLAYWDGNVLRHTDPNGTRKITAAQLAHVWKQGLPEGLGKIRQKEAFLTWVENNAIFTGTKYDHHEKFKAGTDIWHDFQRLITRLENEKEAPVLWRGMSMEKAGIDNFIRGLKTHGYKTQGPNNKPADSWSPDERVANSFAKAHKHKCRVILKVITPKQAKDITPLVRVFQDEIQLKKHTPLVLEQEWLYQGGITLKLQNIKREGNSIYITLFENLAK